MKIRASRAFGCLAVVAVALLVGCAESTFLLANDSRLPAWLELPPGVTRQDVSVRMDYYVLPSGREARFKMVDPAGRPLADKRGKLTGLEPLKLGASAFPSYEIITIDGVSDLIEHRKMEPRFYVVDDLTVRRTLGVGGASTK